MRLGNLINGQLPCVFCNVIYVPGRKHTYSHTNILRLLLCLLPFCIVKDNAQCLLHVLQVKFTEVKGGKTEEERVEERGIEAEAKSSTAAAKGQQSSNKNTLTHTLTPTPTPEFRFRLQVARCTLRSAKSKKQQVHLPIIDCILAWSCCRFCHWLVCSCHLLLAQQKDVVGDFAFSLRF